MKWYLKAEKCRMNGCQNILCYVHWCLDLFDHYTGTLTFTQTWRWPIVAMVIFAVCMQLFIRVQSTPVIKEAHACICDKCLIYFVGFTTLANYFLPPILIWTGKVIQKVSNCCLVRDGWYCTYLFKDFTKMESLEDGLSNMRFLYVCMAAALITHCGQFIASWFCIVHRNVYDFTQKSASILVQSSLPHLALVKFRICLAVSVWDATGAEPEKKIVKSLQLQNCHKFYTYTFSLPYQQYVCMCW